ncbi:MAG: hypothetical protein VB139_06945 [Coriobacteriia bacterium]|nr:hypothetical protein [Coriobacteriia bacterium]
MITHLAPVFEGSRFTRVAFAETLATFYFGPARVDDSLGRYIDRAYRDMNRTLRLGALDDAVRRALRAEAGETLRDAIVRLAQGVELTTCAFDAWHRQACESLKSVYAVRGVAFTHGQAQKWVNMTLKYVFVALALDIVGAPQQLRAFYACAHLPIDSIVLEGLRKQSFDGSLPDVAWSRHDDYDAYLAFQRAIRERFGCGLDAELMLWRPQYETWANDADTLGRTDA